MPTITFLGTAGDARATLLRASGGCIIGTDKNQIHCDPGPGAIIKSDVGRHTAVLITNNDILSSGGVPGILYATSNDGEKKECVLIEPENAKVENMENYTKAIYPLSPGLKVTLKDVEIVGQKTSTNALGYLIYTPDCIIGYCPHTKLTKEIVMQYKSADIMILPLAGVLSEKKEHKITVKDITTMLESIKPQLLILSSFTEKVLENDPLQIARDIQLATGVNTVAAKDGMNITPSAKSIQKRLG